ncbi:MAG: porin [Pseudomonadota bacterium]
MKKLIILIAAVAMVASSALVVSAAEWNFYGSARMMTFSDNVETPGAKDDRDTTWDAQSNSRIGADVKVSDTLEGKFEYGTGVNLRRLYAEWNFGAGKLLAGQEYTPISDIAYSNQVWYEDDNLNSTGIPYAGRVPMLQLTFGGLQVALVKPNTAAITGLSGDQDVTFPKIEFLYTLSMDNFWVDVYGGYETYEVNSVDVDAYVLGVGGSVSFGPAYVRGTVYMAQNGNVYGLADAGDNLSGYNAASKKLIDNDTIGYALVAGYTVSDAITIEAGYGANKHELDVNGAKEDDAAGYYVQAVITLAPGVSITPEIGVHDKKDDASGSEEGKVTYFGAKWQINF